MLIKRLGIGLGLGLAGPAIAMGLMVLPDAASAQVTLDGSPVANQDAVCVTNGEIYTNSTANTCVPGTTNTPTGITINGGSGLTVTNADIEAQGEIQNMSGSNGGAVLVNDNLRVTGTISNNGPGNLPVTVNDNLQVTGGLRVQGAISNGGPGNPPVNINDNVAIQGDVNMTGGDINNVNSLNATSVTSTFAGFGSVNMNGGTISNLADPVLGTDAANKNYVDSQIGAANNQINKAFKDIDENTEGIAVAIALGGLQVPEGKNFAIGANVGFYDDKQAIAAITAIRLDQNFQLRGGVSVGVDSNTAGGRVGLMGAW